MKIINEIILKAVTVSLIIVIFTNSSYIFAETKVYDKELLIVQSYQRDYEHTRQLENGINDYFSKIDRNIHVNYEFLDTKKYSSPENFKVMADMMSRKYKNKKLDGVILCDDDALNFHIMYGKQIWPNTEDIVATGINSITPYKEIAKDVNIIEELPDIQKTIEVALSQNKQKNIDTLNFIYDVTTTSMLMENEIEALVDSKYREYKVNHYSDKTPFELKQLVDNADTNQLFFFVLYSRDRNGIPYYYDEVPRYIVQKSKNPMYGLWEFYMGTGILGGYVASSYLYGKDAAMIMNLIWEDKPVPKIQYENGTHQKYIFDYDVMVKYNTVDVPSSSQIINKPESYFEKNKTLISLFSGIIGVLLVIIFLLSFVIKQKNFLNLKNNEIVELNKDIINTQKDLIARLGDVIETRSHETASHVKRVAEISRFLAIKYGISEMEADILAVISPMHDIGKIGIPEEILHKPGKLTEKEFEIMKYHTNIGYEILRGSDKDVLKRAAIVALEHHEKWDGTGYPNQKYGENIDIFARITAIADVYDAVRSDRVYKKAWSFEEAKSLIEKEAERQFDPELTKLFLENIYEIEKIREDINNNEKLSFNNIYSYIKNIVEMEK